MQENLRRALKAAAIPAGTAGVVFLVEHNPGNLLWSLFLLAAMGGGMIADGGVRRARLLIGTCGGLRIVPSDQHDGWDVQAILYRADQVLDGGTPPTTVWIDVKILGASTDDLPAKVGVAKSWLDEFGASYVDAELSVKGTLPLSCRTELAMLAAAYGWWFTTHTPGLADGGVL